MENLYKETVPARSLEEKTSSADEQLAFMAAVRKSDVEEVRGLLKEDPRLVNQPVEGKYAIFQALHLKTPDVFFVLLDTENRDLTVQQDDHLLLEYLWKYARWPYAQKSAATIFLDDEGAKWPHPLFRSVCLGSHENVRSELSKLRKGEHLRDSLGASPLHYAAANHDLAVLRLMLSHKIYAHQLIFRLRDFDQETVLDWAINHSQSGAVRELLLRGGHWDYKVPSREDCIPEIQAYLNEAFKAGRDTLFYAILWNHAPLSLQFDIARARGGVCDFLGCAILAGDPELFITEFRRAEEEAFDPIPLHSPYRSLLKKLEIEQCPMKRRITLEGFLLANYSSLLGNFRDRQEKLFQKVSQRIETYIQQEQVEKLKIEIRHYQLDSASVEFLGLAAAAYGCVGLMQLLLGIDPSIANLTAQDGSSILELAKRSEQQAIVDMLLQNGAQNVEGMDLEQFYALDGGPDKEKREEDPVYSQGSGRGFFDASAAAERHRSKSLDNADPWEKSVEKREFIRSLSF
jgi:ankyrin repeat protein